MNHFARLLTAALIPTAIVGSAPAQQFQRQPGTLPGATRWTEGVSLADVDNDGDLDILFAEGEGFASAGTQRQNILIINQLVEQGPGIYTEESVARLGVNRSNGKSVVTADVNDDGWVDLLYLNAFNTDPPSLYINRGAAQPGFFDLESSTRGFTESLNSADAQFGDLDDDGDLDVIIADGGDSFLSGPGGKPRLYFNDGDGFFTEDAVAMNAPTKVALMDVQLLDADGDWDLDLFITNRANNSGGLHYLMLNDGAGSFTNVSSQMPATSTLTYEAEPADLDGDTDVDFFFLSQTSFFEGVIRNDIVPSGSFGFTALPASPEGIDDNEVAYLDYDNDGDLDAFVGSLGNRERIYRNNGSAVFTSIAGLITSVADPTLDMAIGDLDGDGDYDVITTQGEGASSQWGNKLYLNTGAADDLAPVALATHVPASADAFPILVHTRVQDQVLDDSVHYLSSTLAYASRSALALDVDLVGGVFSPASVVVASGTRVRFTNQDAAAHNIVGTTALYEFDLPLAAMGGTADFTFVRPGVYTYQSSPGGALGQVTVVGPLTEVVGRNSGGSIFRYELPCFDVPDGEIVVEPMYEDAVGNRSVGLVEAVAYTGAAAIGTNYCIGAINSAGLSASICAVGSADVTDNDFTLIVSNVAPNKPGLFFYGDAPVQVPFNNGIRCVGGMTQRLQGPRFVDDAGRLARVVDLMSSPAVGDITANVPITTYFQFWYRDAMSSNLSDGISVSFQ
ncbi:MAG: plastocyanin [Chlamydiales bacterium]|jgi:plastocyanin